jgi:hypothetical protein
MRRTFRIVLVVLLAAGAIAWFSLDRILKSTIERESTASLRLTTTLGRARLSLLGGKLNLKELRIASPKGFSAPHLLELGDVDLAVKYGQLRSDPIHVQSLTLDRPRLVIEQSGGALNFKKAIEGMPPSQSASENPIKLVIDELKMENAQVVIHPGLPGLRQEITVLVPAINMRNVGSGRGAQNGAAIKDIAILVISAMAEKAAQSDSVPAALRPFLRFDPGQIAKDPVKALEGEVGGLLEGKSGLPAAGRSPTPPKR